MSEPKIIVALDFNNKAQVTSLVKQLDPSDCRLKIGKELFTSFGPDIVREVQDMGFEVFLDLKFHDIPVTVAKACRSAADLGVWMLNVHALGGANMMKSAVQSVQDSQNSPILIAVTILTSHSSSDIHQIGINGDVEQNVLSLANLARNCGLTGVVCSAKETNILRKEIQDDFILVTPGIRPAGSDTNDQKRVVTPKEALQMGSTYLVIGRPVTQSKEPEKALKSIINSLD